MQEILESPLKQHADLEKKLHDIETQLRALESEEQQRSMNEKLERKVRERTVQLSRSNAELEQFAYVASHDLQEPLRTMAAYAQKMERLYAGKLDPSADTYLSYIAGGADRLQLMIRDLLAYARIDADAPRQASVPLSDAVAAALSNLRKSIEESQARIAVGDLPVVPGIPSLLTQVFQNLIGNAIKYRGDTVPQVEIGAERKGKEWVVWVRDNGIGIDPAQFRHLFRVFRRLHESGKYPGTGIGLATCKKVVERHEGRIWIESEPGKGSTFFFSLPAAEQRELKA